MAQRRAGAGISTGPIRSAAKRRMKPLTSDSVEASRRRLRGLGAAEAQVAPTSLLAVNVIARTTAVSGGRRCCISSKTATRSRLRFDRSAMTRTSDAVRAVTRRPYPTPCADVTSQQDGVVKRQQPARRQVELSFLPDANADIEAALVVFQRHGQPERTCRDVGLHISPDARAMMRECTRDRISLRVSGFVPGNRVRHSGCLSKLRVAPPAENKAIGV